MSITADLRQTWRNARRAPGLTLAVVLTLAVGIGANGAVWSVLRAVLLEPLPYPQPERLLKVISKFPTLGFERSGSRLPSSSSTASGTDRSPTSAPTGRSTSVSREPISRCACAERW